MEEDGRQEVQYEDEENLTKGNPPKLTTYEENFANRDRSKLDWDLFKLSQPNFISYICPTGNGNQLLVCAENTLYHFDIDAETSSFSFIGSFDSHFKVVNMCTMLTTDKVISCSREPVIKLY